MATADTAGTRFRTCPEVLGRGLEAASGGGENVRGDLCVLSSLAKYPECPLGVGERGVDLAAGEQGPCARREDRRRLVALRARLVLEVVGSFGEGLLEVAPEA